MTSTRGRNTLLLDELGIVISKLPKDDWSFLGMLRSYSQQGNLRHAISCFEEVFVKQQEEFSGPLVNFGTTMRLEPFSDSDIEELVIAPLEIWKPLQQSDRRALKAIASSVIGHHPYFIQFFCEELFERLVDSASGSLVEKAQTIVRKDQARCFNDPVTQVFHNIDSGLLKYLFLRRCHDADLAHLELRQALLDDDWLVRALDFLGLCATTTARRNILEALEIHGLCFAADYNRSKQRVAVPMIYIFLKEVEHPVTALIDKYAQDIPSEIERWNVEHKKRPSII